MNMIMIQRIHAYNFQRIHFFKKENKSYIVPKIYSAGLLSRLVAPSLEALFAFYKSASGFPNIALPHQLVFQEY